MNQPLSPKDERIASANPSGDASIIGPSAGGNRGQSGASTDAGTANDAGYQLHGYPSLENYYYGGYDSSTSGWSGYPQYASADGLQVVPPVIYGDNTALGLHHMYGFNSQMTYGQYSPVSTPSVVVDNQLFSPQQIPFSPTYYPQAVATSMPNMSASVPVSQDLMNLKGNYSLDSGNNVGFYNMHGMFGSGEPLSYTPNPLDSSRRTVSPVTSTGAYSQQIGPYASYDPYIAQTSQQRPMSGYGLPSDYFAGQYAYDAANQNSNYAYLPSPQPTYNYTNHIYLDKERNSRQQIPSSLVPCDRNRGPRALKVKMKTSPDNNAVSVSSKTSGSNSAVKVESFNHPDFPTTPENAKFFIIKSFSEDNVHRSIKYGVWSSTVHGNKKLDDAYKELKENENHPVYLFFSVNASSQFCGVAEMVGPLDFEKNADYWQQDRWSGQFPVTWHILKDVPNSKFHHLLLENNDNKPVTHSRDSQEVKLEQGIEMLKIFKEYETTTSILDDFDFYDERESMLQERKNRLVAKPKMNAAAAESVNTGIINEISDRLDQALQLEDNAK